MLDKRTRITERPVAAIEELNTIVDDDNDGIPDSEDPDDDNDGIPDEGEANH